MALYGLLRSLLTCGSCRVVLIPVCKIAGPFDGVDNYKIKEFKINLVSVWQINVYGWFKYYKNSSFASKISATLDIG